MGLVGDINNIEELEGRRAVTLNPGADYNQAGVHFADPGEDSVPIQGDKAIAATTQGTNQVAVVGVVESGKQLKSSPGEKRIYSRNADGGEVCELWLKNDGSAILSNDNGTLSLLADGSIDMNGVVIDVDGNITLPSGATLTAETIEALTSLKVATKEVDLHTHTSSSPGNPTSPF